MPTHIKSRPRASIPQTQLWQNARIAFAVPRKKVDEIEERMPKKPLSENAPVNGRHCDSREGRYGLLKVQGREREARIDSE